MNFRENNTWQEAMVLLGKKRLQESMVQFQALTDARDGTPEGKARGYYGLGLVAYELNNIDEATEALELALEEDPTLEEATYWLARLAPPGTYGAYEFLREHHTPQARNALILMHELDKQIHEKCPSTTAYLVQFIPFLTASLGLIICCAIFLGLYSYINQIDPVISITAFALIILLGLYSYINQIDPVISITAFALIILPCLYFIFIGLKRFAQLRSTKYTIAQGRLYVTVGILRKEKCMYELYRVHFINFKQTFFNRLTQDGTLVFDFEIGKGEPREIKITGLARGDELTILYKKLLNLVGSLRNIPDIKGLIQ